MTDRLFSTTTRTPLADVETDSRVGLSIEKACALIDRLRAEKAELLAALKYALGNDGSFSCPVDTEARMLAAIAKAERA